MGWKNKVLKIINDSECRYGSKKILFKMKTFKEKSRDSKGLSSLRAEFMKTLFNNKISIEQANQLTVDA